jgi:hypothetical protein
MVTAPANGSTLSSTVSFSATASDNVGVVGVQFLLDGAGVGPEDTLPPYAIQFDTTAVADGTYALSARARDGAGNQTISIPLTVTISNDGGGEPEPELPPTGPGTIDLTIEPSDPGFRVIRAEADAGGVEQLELYIDGQLNAAASGDSLVFDWDVEPLMGSYQVRVDGLDASGTEVIVSTSLFYAVASPEVPSVSLDVVDFPIIGATFIRAAADVSDLTRLELYLDSTLVLVRDAGAEVDYAWDPVPGTAYQIIFVAYNQSGVAASVTIVHVQ